MRPNGDQAAEPPLDVQDLAAPADAIPDPGVQPAPVPLPERRHYPVAAATTTPREKNRLPLTWSVFVGLLVPAASVAARAAAKRGSR